MKENTQEIECYIENAIRTDLSPEQYRKAAEKIAAIIRLEHAGHGIVTEGGELMDAFKRHVFYGKPLDEVNIKEEVGDLMWYIAILMDELSLQFGIKAFEILEANIAKLRQRYPNKFDETQAINRDTNSERKILENKTSLSETILRLCRYELKERNRASTSLAQDIIEILTDESS